MKCELIISRGFFPRVSHFKDLFQQEGEIEIDSAPPDIYYKDAAEISANESSILIIIKMIMPIIIIIIVMNPSTIIINKGLVEFEIRCEFNNHLLIDFFPNSNNETHAPRI